MLQSIEKIGNVGVGYIEFNHDEHARSCERDDFWGQIRRTVNGVAVDEDQIKLIIDSIVKAMKLNVNDTILDICCGNGALSSRVSQNVCNIIGIDNSEYLISVAKEYFENVPTLVFHKSEIKDFMQNAQIGMSNINKILCYGSISYLNSSIIRQTFNSINAYLPSASHFFIGNIPEKSKAKHFFKRGNQNEFDLESHTTSIGKWWERDEVNELAKKYSWKCDIKAMPEHFYGSTYRFDALLTR